MADAQPVPTLQFPLSDLTRDKALMGMVTAITQTLGTLALMIDEGPEAAKHRKVAADSLAGTASVMLDMTQQITFEMLYGVPMALAQHMPEYRGMFSAPGRKPARPTTAAEPSKDDSAEYMRGYM